MNKTVLLAAASILALSAGSAHAYTYKVLYNMCSELGCSDGYNPNSRLVMDPAGNLYGTTNGCSSLSVAGVVRDFVRRKIMRGKMKSVLAACTMLLASSAFAGVAPPHSSSHSPPTTVTVSCTGLRATEVAVSDTEEQTQSTGWVNLNAAGNISFTSGRSGCVLVTLSAQVIANNGEFMEVQILLDGSTACLPGAQWFVSNQPTWGNRAMTYLCSNVPNGSHAVQVQYLSNAGGLVGFDQRSLTVRHR